MSNETLSRLELEMIRKAQLHFPCGKIPEDVQKYWNGAKKEKWAVAWLRGFGKIPQKLPILELVGTVNISATTEKFIARDRFVINTSDNAPVKILGLGDRIKEEFIDKIEKPIGEINLCYSKLLRNSVNDSIINEFGGEEKAETTLTEMFTLMENQGNGKKSGALLTNGYANIFYICNSASVLCGVGCGWHDDGWFVYAFPVDAQLEWFADSQVFSRRSLES